MAFGFIYLGSFLLSIFLSVAIYRTGKLNISKRLIQLTLLVSFWNLMEGVSFFTTNVDVVLFFQIIKYVSVIFVPPTLLIATIVFIAKSQTIHKFVRFGVYIFPIISFLSVMTGFFPYKFISHEKIYFLNGIPMFSYTKSIGFLLNTAYSYVLILIACYLLLVRAIRSPKIYRIQSMFVFIGCTTSFVLNILFITQTFGTIYIDTTPMSTLVTMLVFYWGVFQLPKTMIVPFARDLVIENMNDLVIIVDNFQGIIDVNPKARALIHQYAKLNNKEFRNPHLTGMNIDELLLKIPQLTDVQSFSEDSDERTIHLSVADKNFYFKMAEQPIYDSDHVIIGKLYLLHNVTQLHEHLNNLVKVNEQLFLSDIIINNALEAIVITDAENRIVKVNHSMERMSGFTSEELIGQNPRLMKSNRHDVRFYHEMWTEISENGFWEGEIWDRKKSGEEYLKWMSITSNKHTDNTIANYIAISSDISKMKKAENDIHLLAYYDPLTGVPNRTLFYDRLKTSLLRAKRSESGVVLFFIDLDRFKIINDSFGHAAGDQLLIEFTTRIKEVIRESDTLSRLGGDEFTIIFEEMSTLTQAKIVAENIMKAMQKSFFIMGREVSIGVSIGIAMAPYDGMTLEGMIRKSDSAMYFAKETGGNKYVFSSEEIERKNQEILELQIRLKAAINNNEFMLYLQPQVSYVNGLYEISGVEALIRWKTSNGEIVQPDQFIPASESNGMILDIGNWVIEEIFRIYKRLKAENIQLKLAFNVSIKQFENEDLLLILKRLLENEEMAGIDLVVEITESMFINDLDKAIEYLDELKALGLSIALDDFGTGFSSMSYLTKLPLDYLKIDKSFVSNMAHKQQRNLTYTIISMARTLNLKTLAEGVETKEQAQILNTKACDALQGYYFSRPIPVEDFITFYHNWGNNHEKYL